MTLPYDRDIAAWLADGPERGPAEPLARALAVTRRTRKRPRWTFPERWLPMQLTMRRPMFPRAFTYLALVALLLVALVAAILLLPGSQPIPEPLGAGRNSSEHARCDFRTAGHDPRGDSRCRRQRYSRHRR